jgi:transposase
MMGTKTKLSYTDEFKQQAVKLVTGQGLSRAQVARDLGISQDTIGRWVRAHTPAPNEPETPATAPQAQELARLRRENEQLRMERDILKKALGIFSQMPQ